jgi:hypothetical protein
MCLYAKNKKPEIAKEDIKVYKVMHVVKSKPSDGEKTAARGFPPYFSSYIYREGLNKPRTESKPAKETTCSPYYCVEEGYLHAFKDWFRAANRVTRLKCENLHSSYYDIVEMYIPAGTTYYVGDDDDIAASALYWPEEDKNAQNNI